MMTGRRGLQIAKDVAEGGMNRKESLGKESEQKSRMNQATQSLRRWVPRMLRQAAGTKRKAPADPTKGKEKVATRKLSEVIWVMLFIYPHRSADLHALWPLGYV